MHEPTFIEREAEWSCEKQKCEGWNEFYGPECLHTQLYANVNIKTLVCLAFSRKKCLYCAFLHNTVEQSPPLLKIEQCQIQSQLYNFGCWLGSRVPDSRQGRNRNFGELLFEPPTGDGVSPIETLLFSSQAWKQKFFILSNLSGNRDFAESCTEGQLFPPV